MDKDQQDSNEDQSVSDNDNHSLMPGLQERDREDSSSEDENSQQNKRRGKKKNVKKKKRKKKKVDLHHRSTEVKFHQEVELNYKSNLRNRAPT